MQRGVNVLYRVPGWVASVARYNPLQWIVELVRTLSLHRWFGDVLTRDALFLGGLAVFMVSWSAFGAVAAVGV